MRLRRLSLEEIARRRADAHRDADLLASGWRPTAEQLADAPFLDVWSETVYPGTDLPAVYGRVTGHPRVGPGPVLTSPVIARCASWSWIRTEGRFYRMGARRAVAPADPVAELVQAWSEPAPAPPPENPDQTDTGFIGF